MQCTLVRNARWQLLVSVTCDLVSNGNCFNHRCLWSYWARYCLGPRTWSFSMSLLGNLSSDALFQSSVGLRLCIWTLPECRQKLGDMSKIQLFLVICILCAMGFNQKHLAMITLVCDAKPVAVVFRVQLLVFSSEPCNVMGSNSLEQLHKALIMWICVVYIH